jgi:hypothetical protein
MWSGGRQVARGLFTEPEAIELPKVLPQDLRSVNTFQRY